MVELALTLVEVILGAALQLASAIRNAATLRRCYASQRSNVATLLRLATQHGCTSQRSAATARNVALLLWRCCSS